MEPLPYVLGGLGVVALVLPRVALALGLGVGACALVILIQPEDPTVAVGMLFGGVVLAVLQATGQLFGGKGEKKDDKKKK